MCHEIVRVNPQLKSSSIRDEIVPAICTQWVNNLIQLYTIRGQIVHEQPSRVTFSIPGMISPSELDPILPYLPTETVEMDENGKLHVVEPFVPREVGGPLINKMLQLTKLADEAYRNHAYRCDRVWKLMMASNGAQQVSLTQIAQRVFKCDDPASISTPMLWCLHRVLNDNDAFTKDVRHHRQIPRLTVVPQEEINNRKLVQQWVRDYQEELASDTTAAFHDDPTTAEAAPDVSPVHAFVKKARLLIKKSRKSRDALPIGRLSPDKKEHHESKPLQPITIIDDGLRFTKKETRILRCIADWVLAGTGSESSTSRSVGPPLLRAIGAYDDFELGRATACQLLQEMSILLPWENRATYFKTHPLPGLGVDAAADKIQHLALSATPRMEDSMADLRKDWGDLPVFCIDSMDTTEVDDGISWEAIDESTGWAHIHVANPSAFIQPKSVTAQYAARLSQTLYLPERRYPMVQPDSLREHCSLAPHSPSITFSAKLTTDGDILETKITHGIVRNVKSITYDTIAQTLFPDEPIDEASAAIFTVGGEIPIEAKAVRHDTLTDSETECLRKLMEFGQAKRLKRIKDTDLDVRQVESYASELRVYLGEKCPPNGFSLQNSRTIIGDPIISLHVKPFDPREKTYTPPSHQVVADLMLIAGEVASKWCAERGIPIAYSGSLSNPHLATVQQKFMADVYKPTVAKYGYCPPNLEYRRLMYMGGTTTSAEPRAHEYLNLSKYTKVTSPLRRYNDLFSHWQIDAAIRQEARIGTSLLGNTDDSFLPFSLAEAKEVISELNIRFKHTAHLKKHARHHWIVQWFNRAYYFNESPLPEKLHIYILQVNHFKRYNQAIIVELGIQCSAEANEVSKAAGGFTEGDTWEAKPEAIDAYRLRIMMKPLRLVEKSPFDFQSYMVPKTD